VQPSLRIVRVDVSGYRLLTSDFAGLDGLHRELQATIRRHLPGVTASVLALPVPSADGQTVDWYSDLAGQPVALGALPPSQRVAIKAKLADRLASLRRLADELPGRVRGSEHLAAALRSATCYPDDTHVYAVGDEPVLTLWGFVLVQDPRRRGALGTAASQASGRRPVRRAWLLGAALLLSLALAAGSWYWLEQRLLGSLQAELGQALAAECAEPHRLAAVAARLDRLDPKGQDYPGLRQTLAAEQARCLAAAGLARDLAAAGWDCARLDALRQGLAGPESTRQPLSGIASDLENRIALCTAAADALARIEARRSDCVALAEIDRDLGAPPAQVLPLRQAREQLDAELTRCKVAAELGEAVAGAAGDCETLRKLEGRLGAHDVTRPPLAPIKARMDNELALCAKAAGYRQQLVDAQMDCPRLRSLAGAMSVEDASREPMASLRQQLTKVLEQCEALEKFK